MARRVDKLDDLLTFKKEATKRINDVTTRLDEISKSCDRIEKAINEMENYSYQFNVNIVGMPMTTEKESAEETTDLCLRLFKSLGVDDITAQDIDIAHRVPARFPSNRPNAIICKFVRRLARNKVMSVRRSVGTLSNEQLGLHPDLDIKRVRIYDHLTPSMQSVL